MRQFIVGVALTFLGLAASAASLPAMEQMLSEKAMGNPAAPVTVIEYASMTCPHCANFAAEVLPQIKAKYIDTGKVRWIFRDYPLDQRAVLGAMLARCGGDDRYWGFLDVLFRSQATWATAQDPKAGLLRLARLGGLTEEDFNACMDNNDLADGIFKERLEAQQKLNVDSTPTFFINGDKHAGEMTLDTFDKLVASRIH